MRPLLSTFFNLDSVCTHFYHRNNIFSLKKLFTAIKLTKTSRECEKSYKSDRFDVNATKLVPNSIQSSWFRLEFESNLGPALQSIGYPIREGCLDPLLGGVWPPQNRSRTGGWRGPADPPGGDTPKKGQRSLILGLFGVFFGGETP